MPSNELHRGMTKKPTRIAAGLLAWTVVAWGGRIGLLTDGVGSADFLRIGGSLLIGLATALALAMPSVRLRALPMYYVFCVWNVVLWGRSLVVNWTGTGSLPFKLVHAVLAIGFFILVVSVWGFAHDSTEKREGRPVRSEI
jgi:hypothetical protein